MQYQAENVWIDRRIMTYFASSTTRKASATSAQVGAVDIEIYLTILCRPDADCLIGQSDK